MSVCIIIHGITAGMLHLKRKYSNNFLNSENGFILDLAFMRALLRNSFGGQHFSLPNQREFPVNYQNSAFKYIFDLVSRSLHGVVSSSLCYRIL